MSPKVDHLANLRNPTAMNTKINKRDATSVCTIGHRPAFLHQIVPGVVGGIASALILYPLEVCETLMQGAAANGESRKDTHQSTCTTSSTSGGAIAFDRRQVAARLPPSIQVATSAFRKGQLFHGFDMAFLSAMFGYTSFFGVFELSASFISGSGPLVLLARNLLAAISSFIVNTPFQLVKTAVVLSGDNARTVVNEVTEGGRNPRNLWRGVLANMLGVVFIALQFALFAIFPTTSGPLEAALMGMVVTALAALATYPVLTVRTAVMATDDDNEKCFRRIVKVTKKMWNERTLYNGVTTNALRTVLPAFILFGLQSLLQG